MKLKAQYIVLIPLFFMALPFLGQNKVLDNARIYIKSGNYNGITNHFSDFVELTTDNFEKSTSKKQAAFVLKDFFKRYPAENFSYDHQGSSPGGNKYCIGSYVSTNGTKFLVVIKLKNNEGTYMIDALKFNKE
jgi:hypothetical protein